MTSLKTLLALKPNVLYPAHGPHVPGSEPARAHIQTYITHRQDRENQIIKILRTAASDPPSTLTALQDLLDKYKVDAKEADDYKKQFLGRLKPKPAGADAEGNAKAEVKIGGEGGASALSLDNLVRLIYGTDNEKTIFAAKKGTRAHLDKLVGEGKVVVRDAVENPVILEGKVLEPKECEAWEWAGVATEAEGGKEGQDAA